MKRLIASAAVIFAAYMATVSARIPRLYDSDRTTPTPTHPSTRGRPPRAAP